MFFVPKEGTYIEDCLQRLSCSKCKKRHPTSLYGDLENGKQKSSHSPRVCYSIEPLMVYTPLDSQSDKTFILDYIVE